MVRDGNERNEGKMEKDGFGGGGSRGRGGSMRPNGEGAFNVRTHGTSRWSVSAPEGLSGFPAEIKDLDFLSVLQSGLMCRHTHCHVKSRIPCADFGRPVFRNGGDEFMDEIGMGSAVSGGDEVASGLSESFFEGFGDFMREGIAHFAFSEFGTAIFLRFSVGDGSPVIAPFPV